MKMPRVFSTSAMLAGLLAMLFAPLAGRGQSVVPIAPPPPFTLTLVQAPVGPLFPGQIPGLPALRLTSVARGKATGIQMDTFGTPHALFYDIATNQLSAPFSSSSELLGTDGGAFVGAESYISTIAPNLGPHTRCIEVGIPSVVPPGYFDAECTGVDHGSVVGTVSMTLTTGGASDAPGGTPLITIAAHNAFLNGDVLLDPTCQYTSAMTTSPIWVGGCATDALAVSGTEQVGHSLASNAVLWHGTTLSMVSLHPYPCLALNGAFACGGSSALATNGSQQGGWGDPVFTPTGTNMTGTHAMMWSGTAASAVDLNPPGYFDTRVSGMSTDFQVGDGWVGGPANSVGATRHALLWRGSAASVVDLNQFLPGGYPYVTVTGTDADGDIVGYMEQAANGAPDTTTDVGFILAPIPSISVASLTLDSANAAPGDTVSGTVSLRAPAAAGGVVVSFTSSNNAVVPPPAPVLVPEGQTSAPFNVSASATAFMTASAAVTLSAHATVTGASATLTVTPTTPADPIVSVTLPSGRVAPGSIVTGLVTLAAPAPDGGVIVNFNTLGQKVSTLLVVNPACGCFDKTVTTYYDPNVWPGGPGLIATPASIVIPAGQTSAPVSVVTGDVGFTGIVTAVLQAATGNVMIQAPMAIAGPTTMAGLQFDGAFNIPTTAPFPGGTSGNSGEVRTNIPPDAPLTVTLVSTNPAVVVPASVTINGGGSTAQSLMNASSGQAFSFSTLPVPVLTTGMVTATANGTSVSAPISVAPSPQPAIFDFKIPFVSSGQTFTGMITLTGPALLGGATISLASDTPGVAAVPATITVPFGATSATFSGVAGPVVGATATVTVTASFNGAATSATLTVIPGPVLAITSFNLAPYSMIGPGSVTNGTITLNQPAPAGGVTIALSTGGSSAAKVPATVTVAQGQTSASFSVQGNGVSAATSVVLSASYKGVLAPLGTGVITNIIVAPTDVLKAAKPTWSTSTHILTATVTSTNPQAIITALNANGNVPLGTMTNQGNGNYTFQTTIASISAVNFKSNLGGATGQGVTIIP